MSLKYMSALQLPTAAAAIAVTLVMLLGTASMASAQLIIREGQSYPSAAVWAVRVVQTSVTTTGTTVNQFEFSKAVPTSAADFVLHHCCMPAPSDTGHKSKRLTVTATATHIKAKTTTYANSDCTGAKTEINEVNEMTDNVEVATDYHASNCIVYAAKLS
jgi:hypothetical protein